MATHCPTCQTENSDTANFCSNCATSLTRPGGEGGTRPLPLAVTRTYESRAWDLKTGSVFGERYQIIEPLGRGGMGRVYRALDIKTHEEVAIKLIRPDIAEDRRVLERFVNEIKLAHRISHRNIGKMYHLGEDQGLHYITMEYVPGEDLKSFIRRSRRLDIATTIAIAKQVCSGLSEAHDAGIIHRDLKPGNIMIDKEGNAKILDFGIARAVGVPGVTAEGSVIGTPEYMSPEQVEGRESDRRSDIYSFGVILFEMVTGRLPFAADTPFAVAFKQQAERPPQPEELNPQTPPQLSAIILRCLEKDRDKRYQATGEICRDLSALEETIHTTPVTSPWAGPGTRRTTRKLTRAAATGWKGAAAAFPWKKAALPVAGFLALLALGIGVRELLPRATGAVRRVAVVGFENLTGDATYDYLKKAIPNLLITSLEQSKYLEVMSWERLNELAGGHEAEAATPEGREAWFEACRREGVAAIVLGSFTKAENLFATDAKIYDVETKNMIRSTGSRGEGVGSILRTQIDELSRDISRSVGLSERAAARGAKPISEVTTVSMEAYQLLLKGQEDFERFYHDEARMSFEKAVEKDPNFALPYFYLAQVHKSLADAPKAAAAMDKFKKLSKASPGKGKDALYVAALSDFVEGDWDGYRRGLDEIIRTDPRDKRAHAELAWFLRNHGKFDEAIAEFEKALEIDPDFGYALNLMAYTLAETGKFDRAFATFERYAAAYPGEANPLDSMGDLHFKLGGFDKARAMYRKALAIRPDFASIWKLAYLQAMDGDYETALRLTDDQIARARTDGMKVDGRQWKGLYLSVTGRFDEALAELEEAWKLAQASGNTGLADMVLRDALWICYDWGRFDLFRQYRERRLAYRAETKQGTATLNKIYELLYAGLYDVATGDVAAARTKLEGIAALAGEEGEKEKSYRMMAANQLGREVLLAEGAYDKAVALFGEDPRLEINMASEPTARHKNLPFTADFVARALQKKGATDGAVKEYERLVAPDAAARQKTLVHPFSVLRLAGLYEAQGDLAAALRQYERLAKIWKQADPGRPEVAAVRKKVQELKAKTGRPAGSTVEAFYPLPLIGAL